MDNKIITTYLDGSRVVHNKEGQLHCEDGPALLTKNGSKFWYKNDELHREDGPAIEFYFEGDHDEYFFKGKRIYVSSLREFQSYIRNKAFW